QSDFRSGQYQLWQGINNIKFNSRSVVVFYTDRAVIFTSLNLPDRNRTGIVPGVDKFDRIICADVMCRLNMPFIFLFTNCVAREMNTVDFLIIRQKFCAEEKCSRSLQLLVKTVVD